MSGIGAGDDIIDLMKSLGEAHRKIGELTMELALAQAEIASLRAKIKQQYQDPEITSRNRAKGGHARAAKMTPERRREIAMKANAARWGTPNLTIT